MSSVTGGEVAQVAPPSLPVGERPTTCNCPSPCRPGRGRSSTRSSREELGYDRFWLFDSAALYEDIWIALALVAEHTDIDIGTAVLVPNLRHVMTTASAIATIERMAPGRLACGFGTGATARWVLNQNALSWATTRRYLEQLRGLLRGEVVEIDGERCQMIHHADWATARPIDTPLLVSALGPKGIELVGELHRADVIDGFIGMSDVVVDLPWRVRMTAGTVLEPGETMATARVQEALGPWYVVRYHGVWQAFPDARLGHAARRGVARRGQCRAPRGRASPRGARRTRDRRDAA